METIHLFSRWKMFFTMIVLIGLAVSAPAYSTSDQPSDVQVFNIIRSIQMEYAEVELEDFRQAKRTGRDTFTRAIEAMDLDRLRHRN